MATLRTVAGFSAETVLDDADADLPPPDFIHGRFCERRSATTGAGDFRGLGAGAAMPVASPT